MTSKARMTFRFEPLPAPKASTPVQAARTKLIVPANAEQALTPQPDPLYTEQQPPAVIESYPPLNGPYLDDDIRALEEMIRRTDSIVVHIPSESQPAQPLSLSQEANQSSPIIDWKLPAVKERKPRIVRELEQVETDHEQPERWSLPAEEDGAYRPTSSWLAQAGSYVPPSAPSWTRVILSVAAAIVTGALFGYMVLTLFTGEPMFPSKSSPAQTESVLSPSADPAPASTLPQKTGSEQNNLLPSGTVPAASSGTITEIPADEVYVLQYGVFRTKDSAQLAAAQLQDVGLPAAIDDSDGYRVYAGIATTKAEAELLAEQMPNIEVYVRPANSTALVLNEGDQTDAAASLLTHSTELRRLIAQITVTGLQDDLPQPISPDDADALKQVVSKWQASRTATQSLSGEVSEQAGTLEQSLESALASLASYNDKPSRYHLWKAQSAVIQARLADAKLRQALDPATRG